MKTIKFIIFSILLSISHGFAYDYEISVCAIFQNEAPYIKEWLDYHLHVGVDHFWLYNNDSQDDFRTVLQPYIDDGIVELLEWPGEFRQADCYNDGVKHAKGKTNWIAFIDLDEYIVPKFYGDIKKVLKRFYKAKKAIYVHWLQFGTGGVNLGPGPILPYLTKCSNVNNGWNRIGKPLLRLEVLDTIKDIHYPTLKAPYRYYDGSGNLGEYGLHAEKYLRINHYTFRDEWYFWNVKVPRIINWGGQIEDLLIKNPQFSECEDRFILQLLPK